MTDRAFDQIEGMNLGNKKDISLNPWTEYVGKVIDVTADRITLAAVRHISITITPDILKESRILRKGGHVGILMLDDGSLRVRSASF